MCKCMIPKQCRHCHVFLSLFFLLMEGKDTRISNSLRHNEVSKRQGFANLSWNEKKLKGLALILDEVTVWLIKAHQR